MSRPRGDALLVVATGIERTVLSQAAYQRATGITIGDADLTDRLYVPGGRDPIPVRFVTLARLALAANEVASRGPCDELWASRQMKRGGCQDSAASRCACATTTLRCTAGASVELDADVPVAIVADTSPVLQGIRDELRPNTADVDGFLGASALGHFRVDMDNPNGRLIFRCNVGQEGCRTVPRIVEASDVLDLPACVAGTCGAP